MAFLPSPGAEPIPGYRLEKRLGTGGYGEVWQVTAPGGLVKAIKVIFGNTGDTRATQELKALNRIKEVRHPFLLSLERVEIVENQVFIVTELADESLLDRFEACRRAGLPGIPREELLPYLRDTADALDYMNEQHGLQHLDIKPQNLLLVARRIKIADFGLVKDLCGTSVTATGGVTPLYASPEAFDNRVSRFSDQYSLAIVYQEMLTGIRPFPGKTTLQLAAQHLTSSPLLDPLPVHDRAVIGRALAKAPEQRFPTCRAMVEQLLANTRPVSAPAAAPRPPASREGPHADWDTASTQGPEALASAEVLGLDTLAGPPPVASPLPELVETGPFEELIRKSQTPTGPTELRPTLFIGLGGLAATALRQLRQRLHQEFGNLAAVPLFRLLLLDTDRAGFRPPVTGMPGEALEFDETLFLPLHRPEHYRAESKDLLRWLDRRWLYGIPRSQLTEGVRALGRLALVTHGAGVLTQLRDALTQLGGAELGPSAVHTPRSALRAREEAPRIFIVAGISGGTGGGMLVDVAYAVRQVLGELSLSSDGVCGILMHATGQRPGQADLARINAYATLTEVNHFSRPDTAYPGDPRHGLRPAAPQEPPFPDCYFVHLGDQLNDDRMTAAAREVGEYLFLNATTALGTFLDQYRESTRTAPAGPGDGARVRTFRLARIVFPRQALAEAAADLLCQQVLGRWQGDHTRHDDEALKAEAQARATVLQLDAESLTARLYATVQAAWGEEPGAYFRKILADCIPATTPSSPAQWAEWTRQVLGALDDRLGIGPAGSGEQRAARTPLEIALRDQAEELGAALSRGAMDWLIQIIDEPKGRIKTAEGAAGCLQQHLAAVMEGARSLMADYRTSQANLRQQLATGEATDKATGSSWFPIGNRHSGTMAVVQKLPEYCWLRLKDLVMETTLTVLGTVTQRVAKFAQQLPLARHKLAHFAERFQTEDRGHPLDVRTELLPGQARTLSEAARGVFQRLEPKLSATLDEAVQADVLRPRGGLWSLLSQPTDPVEGIIEELRLRARAAMQLALRDIEAAELFLAAHPDPAEAKQTLQEYLEAASPRLTGAGDWRHLVVALPGSPAGTAVKDLISQTQSEMPTTVLDSQGDVILCGEGAHLPLHQLAADILGNEPSYLEIARQVMTRVDVSWTPFATIQK